MSKLTYSDPRYHFFETFDSKTGFTIRSNVYDRNGKDTGKDAFRRSFPQLIDVGIMGHCASAGVCPVGCYQGGAAKACANMSLKDFQRIANECEGKTFQFALGGRGNPNQHENFEEILECCADSNIVPNYTTSGIQLTQKQVDLTKKYCGAVAVSDYGFDFTKRAIEMFIAAKCTTNIHFVLSNRSIDRALDILEHPESYYHGINAIIFLLHKPVGLGKVEDVINPKDPKIVKFFDLVDKNASKLPFQIGFDACSIPGIVNFTHKIMPESTDTCEGARFSCYITPDMIMTPCSFDQALNYGVSLDNMTIEQAWNSDEFGAFRYKLAHSCPHCKNRDYCMGGCPLQRTIVLCNSDKKKLIA